MACDERCMKLTEQDVKNIQGFAVECDFKTDDGSCDYCDHPTARTWYERTSYEYDEGNYYCDLCALRKIYDMEHQSEWYEKTHFKELSEQQAERIKELEAQLKK